MTDNDMNAIQNFLDMQDYQHQQIINNQMSDEELQQVLGGLTGVPRPPQEFEYGQAHAEDLKKIFIRSCYEMSKWYYKNQVQFVSSMWPAQFVRDASEATGQELSLAFIRDALGRQSNLLLEQFLNQGSKHPNIRLFKGKEMTKRIADHFYSYANNTFGWRETEKSTITLEGDWEGAALLMPRNNEDTEAFIELDKYEGNGPDFSQSGAPEPKQQNQGSSSNQAASVAGAQSNQAASVAGAQNKAAPPKAPSQLPQPQLPQSPPVLTTEQWNLLDQAQQRNWTAWKNQSSGKGQRWTKGSKK